MTVFSASPRFRSLVYAPDNLLFICPLSQSAIVHKCLCSSTSASLFLSFSELFVVDLSTLFVVVNRNNVLKRNGLLRNVSSLFIASGSGERRSRIEHNHIPRQITLRGYDKWNLQQHHGSSLSASQLFAHCGDQNDSVVFEPDRIYPSPDWGTSPSQLSQCERIRLPGARADRRSNRLGPRPPIGFGLYGNGVKAQGG
jgi:hypothetical protein